ncbi:hypothetical protein [Cystobacter fuscus]|uniref:hypothetical protein n=1 Tax=Cystobacter fuscus TaxID=43 RepID=UPI002B299EF5|nr:hypothetical protein F0U63_17050 [Cystobacter fuscus]
MAQRNTPHNSPSSTSGLGEAVEQAGFVGGTEVGGSVSAQSLPPADKQPESFGIQKIALALRGRNLPHLAVGGVGGVGAAVTAQLLFPLLKLPEGRLWGFIEAPSVVLGVCVVVWSFGVKLASIIAPAPQHYLRVLEAWLMYRMRCIPPAVYFEHVAKLHAARLKRHLPAEAPTKRDATVLRTLRWKMDSDARKPKRKKRKRMRGMGT